MARPKPEKPAARTIYGVGFLKAADGNVVAVRGLMDLGACESLSPVRTDADMASRPVETETEPDTQGRTQKRMEAMLVKVGEHRVHGQTPFRTGQVAKRAL